MRGAYPGSHYDLCRQWRFDPQRDAIGHFLFIRLAIPFLLAALGVTWVTTLIRKYGKVIRGVEIAMGALIVLAGILLFLGSFNLLASFVDPFAKFGL